MPWLSLPEFNALSAAYRAGGSFRDLASADAISERSREFLSSDFSRALQSALKLNENCNDLGITILYPGHSMYPKGYFDLDDPPLFLSLEGNWSDAAAIAIVGSREPSRFAIDWLNEHLHRALEERECLVVSGGARGIDMAAHLAALRKGRPTLVFLPSGLTNFYPRDLQRFKHEILEGGGGFVSEFDLQTEMKKFHFIKRNRLIVAAADLIFVAEARRQSGSMLTARIATGMSKNVCTLPSAPAMMCSQGSLDLIFDGAFPLRDYLDLTSLMDLSSKRDVKSELPRWQIRN